MSHSRRRTLSVPLFVKLMVFLLMMSRISEGTRVNYDGWKVLAVKLEEVSGNYTPPTLKTLLGMEAQNYLRVLPVLQHKGTVEVVASEKAFEDLSRMKDDNSISFIKKSDDFGKILSLEHHNGKRSLPRGRVTFKSYMTYDEISNYLKSLPDKYPKKVRVEKIGKSVENNDIYLVRVSKNIKDTAKKRVIFVDGGIHAREWVSIPAVLYAIKKLINSKKLTQRIEWQLIPLLNPDGYIYSMDEDRLWRKNRSPASNSNCFGVDLNRNFGYKWGASGSSDDPCSDIYKGTSAFSEPESKVLQNAMLSIKGKVKAYLTFHSYGQMIIYPWGYSSAVPHPDEAVMDKAAKGMVQNIKKLTKSNYISGNSATVLYPASGASDDWVSHEMNIPHSYTVELRDRGSYGFILPTEQILPTAEEAWIALRYMGKLINKNGKKNQQKTFVNIQLLLNR